MTKQVYMYSCYPDLDIKSQGYEAARQVQRLRDQAHFAWMLDQGIKPYPKTVMDHQKERGLFEARSRNCKDCVFLFRVTDKDVEVYCKSLYQGKWSTHESLEDAQRKMMEIPRETTVVCHMQKVL